MIALEILRLAGAILAALFLAAVVIFIVAVCIMVVLRAVFMAETNGYQQRFRLPKQRTPKRTLIITPDHKHPDIVGDVSQDQWPKARPFASRANVKREG